MAAAEASQKLECSICKTTFARRDWGGFCSGCGFTLPDREDSLVFDELDNIKGRLGKIPGAQWGSFAMMSIFFGGIFVVLTALLFQSPGSSVIIPGTPINLATLVWLATGGPLFGLLALTCSTLEIPE